MSMELGKDRKNLLNLYFYGSLAVLLFCLSVSAFLFSNTFMKKEEERASIYASQLSHFFEFQYRKISEEMWTSNFEAISARVADIAEQLGKAKFDLILADENGTCVYSRAGENISTTCTPPDQLTKEMPSFKSATSYKPVTYFNEVDNRHVYMVPLYVGPILKGFLYSSLSDPYQFYRGSKVLLAIKLFGGAFLFICLVWCAWLLISRAFILKPYLETIVDLEKREALGYMAVQVAHDIGGPLTTLSNIADGPNGLSARYAKLFRAAASRIQSISDDLLVNFKNESSEGKPFTLVSGVVHSIVAEKIAGLPENSAIEIKGIIDPSATMIGSSVSSSDLSRVLSNIVNNSIDATRGRSEGNICVKVSKSNNKILIAIDDNGIGIKPETLHKIRSIGGSDKIGGHGLGLNHAKEVILKAQGTFDIQSIVNKGTVVTVELPITPRPVWCADHIPIGSDDKILVLDDDECAILLWRDRFVGRDVFYIKDSEEFDLRQYPKDKFRYIFDYEISGNAMTGLDLIRTNNLADRAVLVTSYFNDQKIQKLVQAAGATMLPKSGIPEIEIRSDCYSNNRNREMITDLDLVLIDDDPMIHEMWQLKAEEENKRIKTFYNEEEFRKSHIAASTALYIDLNLSEKAEGLEVAKRLHAAGFTSIYLTSSGPLPLSPPSFLKGVGNKNFPYVKTKQFSPQIWHSKSYS